MEQTVAKAAKGNFVGGVRHSRWADFFALLAFFCSIRFRFDLFSDKVRWSVSLRRSAIFFNSFRVRVIHAYP